MTYMAGDHRECANRVRDMMKTAKAQRQSPYMGEREKQLFQNVYLFGHYDSRGGAAIVQAPNLASAMVAYAVGMDFNVENANDVWAVAEEDYIGKRELIVLDEPFDMLEPQELLRGYAEPGYKVATAKVSFPILDNTRWAKDDRFLVLYRGKLPANITYPQHDTEYKFSVNNTLGEDAWGLYWIVYDPAFDVQVPGMNAGEEA